MAIQVPGTLLTINGNAIAKLKTYKVQPNKLWSDSGRAMNGDLRATFVGIFPKLLLEFATSTADEVSAIASLIDLPSFTVVFFDPRSQTNKTGVYYAGDYDINLMSKSRALYQPFDVNLIPYKKQA